MKSHGADRLLLTVAIQMEHDVVLSRQRARQIAALLGYTNPDQVRIATAVSEIARNIFCYAKQGKVEFSLIENEAPAFQIRATDQGPGIRNLQQILNGEYVSNTGMGLGILGARRLVDHFKIISGSTGTTVTLAQMLPRPTEKLSPQAIGELMAKLAQQASHNPFEEARRQNQELLATLQEVENRQTELVQLNRELQDTNRGVVALYAELDERADYLRRAAEIKTQFLSNMTHEFRTPLNSILSLSRILLDHVDGELNTEQQRQVKFIQKAATDLSEIVNDLLDLAKVEAGKVMIRPNEFLIHELFGALRGMLRPLLSGNSSVSLIFDDPTPEVPPLHTDESKVSQILRNLVSNALKFTEAGEVRVQAAVEQDWIAISVADTGIGIALADQGRIFEEFSQVEGEHQKGKKGTGLGLPLSRKLAELLGGSLSVSSELGTGSTFTLRIPAKYKGPEEVSFVPEITAEVDPNRLQVLVVEDNRETLFIYEKYFKGTAFQPIPARTLKQAKAWLEKFRPTAIILDIMLAHESTWAFLSDFKQNPETLEIPVFVVTMVENQAKARMFGADAYHEKPVERQWLLNELNRYAPQQAPLDVLLIDDDEASRYVLKGLLSELPVRPVEAINGREGLKLARQKTPAAIFLDLSMPDVNGLEVLKNLKSDKRTKQIPVVVHTSQALNEQEKDALQHLAVAFMDKNHGDRRASAKLIRDVLYRAIQPTHRGHANVHS